jgi:hypothetical protein
VGRITSLLVIATCIVVGIIVTFRWEGRSAMEPNNDTGANPSPHRGPAGVSSTRLAALSRPS